MRRLALAFVHVVVCTATVAAQTPAREPSSAAVEQLRLVIGTWDVTTEFIADDGSVANTVQGQYQFEWVLQDRIVSGRSHIPELNQVSAILLFVRPGTSETEMVSVGADGHLWRMIGPDDGETRTTPDTKMADGSTLTLRFTRYDVTADSFRSRMEISTDGGDTWRLGNRQHFTRASVDRGGATQGAPIFTFHSGFWLNLHHFLYVLGRVDAAMPDITRRAVAGVSDDEARGLAAASDSERRLWRDVVAAYANGPSRRDPVFDHDLIAAGMALARAGNAASLEGSGVSPDLVSLMERAAPLYRRVWWASHDSANRAREQELTSLVSRHGAPVLAFITRVYPYAWPDDGYPVQLAAWVNWAGAFSTGDRHLVVSSTDEGTRGNLGLEILFHEAMHQWDHEVQNRLDVVAAAAGKRIDGPLSHAMIFYTAGEAVRSAVPGHGPYAEVNGLWRGRMGAYRTLLDDVWSPYLAGTGTFDDAIRRIVDKLP